MKNQVIIFSKNRPCQLHLLLESINTNASFLFDKITVLYKSDDFYKTNYEKLKNYFFNTIFVEEFSFKQNLLNLIDNDYGATTLLVDDSIIYEPVDASKENILGDVINNNFIFSLRLGKNCTYSHPANLNYSLKEHKETEQFILIDYTKQAGDFNYPLSTDGHIYKTELLKALLDITPFNNPNTLEANLQYFVKTNQIPKIIKSFKKSKLVSVPVNTVNTVFKNRCGLKYNWSFKQLNDNYSNGLIIDLERLSFDNIDGPHKELLFHFKNAPQLLNLKNMTSVTDDQIYPTFCKKAATDENTFATFKSHSTYTVVLEHATHEQGLQYLNRITHFENFVEKINLFKINDSLGLPNVYNYEKYGTFSPTTLRYIKILTDLSQLDLNNKDIIEIGAGYGGQYTILRQMFTPKSYTFVDLAEVLGLIKKYISALKLDDIPINYVDAKSLNEIISSDLLISNYAFSECNTAIQDNYIEKILNHSKHGYMICNNLNGYSHEQILNKITKRSVLISEEIPKTYYKNVLLTW